MDADAQTLGNLLRDLRVRAGLTQEQLAERLDAAQPYVSQVERGTVNPSWRYLVKVADAVGTSIVAILRQAGLIPNVALNLEEEIAELSSQVPEFAELFDIAKEYPEELPEIVRYARYVTQEIQRAKAERD